MRIPSTLSLVVLCITSVACNNAPSPATPTVSSEPETPSAPPPSAGADSPEGGDCSDDVAIQKKCAAGLVCAPNPKAPVSEHTPGICKKP